MPDQVFSMNQRQYLEFEKIGLGVFAPLGGFMTEEEFVSVVDTMYLPDGTVFTIPIFLDVDPEIAQNLSIGRTLRLEFNGAAVGSMNVQSLYTCDKENVARKVYGTDDRHHAGVEHFYRMGDWFIGGNVTLERRVSFEFSRYELSPEQTRAHFKKMGWNTVVGFQTRNVPHRAHEYLLRLGLEYCDGLFVQPLVGAKKEGDYTPEAILSGYEALTQNFLPSDRLLVGILSTAMRYAGPREAVFHALVRRNYGCTHFIVGRDHAGVGDYYGKYEAHALAKIFEKDLGINILTFYGPFYCAICDMIVTERTCHHPQTDPDQIMEISGTNIRHALLNGGECDARMIRPEVLESIRHVPIFIEEVTK